MKRIGLTTLPAEYRRFIGLVSVEIYMLRPVRCGNGGRCGQGEKIVVLISFKPYSVTPNRRQQMLQTVINHRHPMTLLSFFMVLRFLTLETDVLLSHGQRLRLCQIS